MGKDFQRWSVAGSSEYCRENRFQYSAHYHHPKIEPGWACLVEAASIGRSCMLHTLQSKWALCKSEFRLNICNLPRSDSVWSLLSNSVLTFQWSIFSFKGVYPSVLAVFILITINISRTRTRIRYVLGRALKKCPGEECHVGIMPWLWTSKLHCCYLWNFC